MKNEEQRKQEEESFITYCVGIGLKMNSDPRVPAWLALTYLMCADRVNISISYYQLAFSTELDTVDYSWSEAKAEAIMYADKALESLEPGTESYRFVSQILKKAEEVQSSPIPKTCVRKGLGGYPASITPHPADVLLANAGLTFDEVNDFAKQFSGHEWLTEAKIKPVESKGCFIATAAYGSKNAHEVLFLRAFRDESLSQNILGRWFVQAYYSVSPSLAKIIVKSELLRGVVRKFFLQPLIFLLNYFQRK